MSINSLSIWLIIVPVATVATDAISVDHCSISRIVAIRNYCFLLDYFKEVR
jgi:hypothetical protein